MLTLYHFNEATCGTKVRLVLAEKDIPYDEVIVTREQLAGPEYRQLNPDGVVPTLVVHSDAGQIVLRESSVIMSYLDEIKAKPALLPSAPIDRAKVRWWMKRADDVYLPALGAATYATIMRHQYMPIDSEKVDRSLQSISDPVKRSQRRDILMKGLESTIVHRGVQVLGEMLADIDVALRESAFLCGDSYTLADAALTPFLLRCDILGILDLKSPEVPKTVDYWERLKSRPSFEAVVTSRTPKAADEAMRAVAAAYREPLRAILRPE